jgi:hypothetical protein
MYPRSRNLLCLGIAAGVVTAAAGTALARTITIDLTRNDVEVHQPADGTLGNYYTFSIPIPQRLAQETLMDATFEFYVDATSDVDDAARGGVVTLEVFELNSPLTVEVSRSDLRGSPMKRTVPTGTSRHLRVNIFAYVREALEQTRVNCDMVVGSLTGQRLGRFTLRHDGFDQRGVAARVTFVFVELGDRLPAEQ